MTIAILVQAVNPRAPVFQHLPNLIRVLFFQEYIVVFIFICIPSIMLMSIQASARSFQGSVRSCGTLAPCIHPGQAVSQAPLLCSSTWSSVLLLLHRGIVWCSLRSPEGKIVPELQPLRWEWLGRLPENSWAQQKHPGAIKHGSYFCAVLVVVWGFFQEVLSVNTLCNFGSAQGGFVWQRLSHGEAEGKAFLPGCCISFSQE